MSERGGPNWSILIAGSAMLITFAGGLWSLVNPQRDTEKIEKRLSVLEETLSWKYVTKESALKDLTLIDRAITELKASKTDKDIYEQKSTSVDRQISLLRERQKDLDHSVNQTFNARDALNSIATRLLELERAGRNTKP